jgi:hypothetical protein
MKVEARKIQRYLHDTLAVEAPIRPWKADQMPAFLRERYTFAQMDILATPCLLIIDTGTHEESPAVIRKHVDMLRSKQERELIYVRPQVTAYNRKRLIEQKVPFIVPGNQLYLPMLGVDLRERFRNVRTEVAAFSPATQAVVIQAILNHQKDQPTPLEMARRLGYSAMTMTRVFDELEAAKIGTTTRHGRERRLQFPEAPGEIWAKSQPFLRTPVAKRWFIRHDGVAGTQAGLTALAHYSMISPPPHPTLAVGRDQWKAFQHRHRVVQLPETDPDAQEIQVWLYAPELLAREGAVDRLSLYLSLKGDADERVQTSLEEMMRGLRW